MPFAHCQTAFGQKLMEDEEARNAAELGFDAFEGGAVLTTVEQLRRFAVQVIEFIARVL